MKRLSLVMLVLAVLTSVAHASEKPNTVLIHPGEVLYARFAEHGKKLKLLGVSKVKDDQAQLILTFEQNTNNVGMTLKLHNHFAKDLLYQVEMRSLTKNLRLPTTVYPVVTEKMSIDPVLPKTEELAVFGFELIL